jgi:hypothetical protein
MKAHTKTSNQTYHSTNVRKTLDTAGRDLFRATDTLTTSSVRRFAKRIAS